MNSHNHKEHGYGYGLDCWSSSILRELGAKLKCPPTRLTRCIFAKAWVMFSPTLLNICKNICVCVCVHVRMFIFVCICFLMTSKNLLIKHSNMKVLINKVHVKSFLQHALSKHQTPTHVRMGVGGLMPIDNRWIDLIIGSICQRPNGGKRVS